MRAKFGLLAAAVSLALVSQGAQAMSYATATLGPVTVTLIDLNPLDSILPSINWGNNTYYGYSNYTYVYAYDTANGNFPTNGALGTYIGSNNSSSTSTAHSAATSSISSGGDETNINGMSMASYGYADGTTVAGNYSYFQGGSYAPYYNYDTFTLGAYTGVVFSANVSASASTTVGYQEGWGNESASASSVLNVWGTQPSGNSGSQSSYSSISANASYDAVWNNQTQTYDYIGQNDDKTDVLGAAYINYTGSDKVGYLQVNTYVSGISCVASAVPESDAYALMMAGLVLIGSIARRKSK